MDNQLQISEREWASDEYDGLAPISNAIKGQVHIDQGYPIVAPFPYGFK
jgi:hypothetical protein